MDGTALAHMPDRSERSVLSRRCSWGTVPESSHPDYRGADCPCGQTSTLGREVRRPIADRLICCDHIWRLWPSIRCMPDGARLKECGSIMQRLYFAPVSAIIFAFGLVSCDRAAAVTSRQVSVAYVYMRDHTGTDPYVFAPRTITVRSGTRIVWRNQTTQPHTVSQTGEHPFFDSGSQTLIAPHHDWSFVFRRPGRYSYSCLLHPFMKGTVIVKAATPKQGGRATATS